MKYVYSHKERLVDYIKYFCSYKERLVDNMKSIYSHKEKLVDNIPLSAVRVLLLEVIAIDVIISEKNRKLFVY